MLRRTGTVNKGFTLLELIVALAVFSVVMLIGTGAVLSALSTNKKAQSVQLIMNNLNFALESITRTMRTGTVYHCQNNITRVTPSIDAPRDCSSGANAVAFEPALGSPSSPSDQVVYRANTHPTVSGAFQIERSVDGAATFVPITALEVVIENLQFYVTDTATAPTNVNQARAVIVLHGYAAVDPRQSTPFNIQTSVTQRLLDI